MLPQLIVEVDKLEVTDPGVAPDCAVRTVSGLVVPETVKVETSPLLVRDTMFVFAVVSFTTTEETLISELEENAEIVRLVSSVESD